MASRVFLGFSALLWLPYGVLCLAMPSFLEGAAGVAATTTTGTVELRAMYGGLQIAIGVLCGLGYASSTWRRNALMTLGMLTAGLGLARLAGVVAAGELSSYTAAGLAFEFASAFFAFTLARESA